MSSDRPAAISAAKSRAMSKQRERDTTPEVRLRRELYRRGLRYRLHRRPVPGLRRTADLVFVGPRVAVFVHGCFWHSCPEHGTRPKSNAEWWEAKLRRNRERDAETVERLRAEGWRTVVVWEHEDPVPAADRVQSVVAGRGRAGSDGGRSGSGDDPSGG